MSETVRPERSQQDRVEEITRALEKLEQLNVATVSSASCIAGVAWILFHILMESGYVLSDADYGNLKGAIKSVYHDLPESP